VKSKTNEMEEDIKTIQAVLDNSVRLMADMNSAVNVSVAWERIKIKLNGKSRTSIPADNAKS